MKKIAILYGSTTGNTEEIAKMIAGETGEDKVDLLDVSNASVEDVLKYDKLIMGTSTWGSGDMQDDWEAFAESLRQTDLTGKKIALFGVGDSVTYSDTFVGGMGELYEVLKDTGAHFYGKVPADGYDYDDSPAEIDGMFVGLALDQDNEEDLTEERIKNWINTLKEEGFFDE